SGNKRIRVARVNLRPRAGVAAGGEMLQASVAVANLADHVTVGALKGRLSAADLSKVEGDKGELAVFKRELRENPRFIADPKLRENPREVLRLMEEVAPIMTRELRGGRDLAKALVEIMPQRSVPSSSVGGGVQRAQVTSALLTTPLSVLEDRISNAESRGEIAPLQPAQRAAIQTGVQRLQDAVSGLDPEQRLSMMNDPSRSRQFLGGDEAIIIDDVVRMVQQVPGLDRRIADVRAAQAPQIDRSQNEQAQATAAVMSVSRPVLESVARQAGVKLSPNFLAQVDRLQSMPVAERSAVVSNPEKMRTTMTSQAAEVQRAISESPALRAGLARASTDRGQAADLSRDYQQSRIALVTSDQRAIDVLVETELADPVQRGKWEAGMSDLQRQVAALPTAARNQLAANPAQARAMIAEIPELTEVLRDSPNFERSLAQLAPRATQPEDARAIDQFHVQRIAATAPVSQLQEVLDSAPMTPEAKREVAPQLRQLQSAVAAQSELLRNPDALNKFVADRPDLQRALDFEPFRTALIERAAPVTLAARPRAENVQEPAEVQAIRSAMTTSLPVVQAQVSRAQASGRLSASDSQSLTRAVDQVQRAVADLPSETRQQVLENPTSIWEAVGAPANDLRVAFQRPEVQSAFVELGQQRAQVQRVEIEQAQANVALVTRDSGTLQTQVAAFRRQNQNLPTEQGRILDQGVRQLPEVRTQLDQLAPDARARVLADPEQASRFVAQHAPQLAQAMTNIPALRSNLADLGPSEERITESFARRDVQQLAQVHRAVASLDEIKLLDIFANDADRDALREDIQDVQEVIRRDPTLLGRPNDLAETIQIVGQRALFSALQRPEVVQRVASALPDRAQSSDAARDVLKFNALKSMKSGKFADVLTTAVSQAAARGDQSFAKALGVQNLNDTREVATRVVALSKDFERLQSSDNLQSSNTLSGVSSELAAVIDHPNVTRQLAEFGGIDLSSKMIDLQIKRDGKGFILPVQLQDLDNIQIDGLAPVLLNIMPATVKDIPLIMGSTNAPAEQSLPEGLSQVR
ncbi:MAG: hypothetical protein NUV91_02555, partial [Candidatus Omnitrophica bacterium]|nr:hypothetical protein [Candidatus Omnitrophota bacterium]